MLRSGSRAGLSGSSHLYAFECSLYGPQGEPDFVHSVGGVEYGGCGSWSCVEEIIVKDKFDMFRAMLRCDYQSFSTRYADDRYLANVTTTEIQGRRTEDSGFYKPCVINSILVDLDFQPCWED